MSASPARVIPSRRLLLLGGAFALSVLSCGREPTGPGGPGGILWSRALVWNAQFPAGYAEYVQALGAAGPTTQSVPGGAGSLVTFTKVRIVLNNADGSVALDTTVNFPEGATELPVTLNIPLPANAPSTGVPLSLNLKYVNAAGDTVFKGGPATVTAVPATPGQPAPPPSPVNIPISYSGPGAGTAVGVRISPKTLTVNTGQTFNVTGQALDAGGAVLSGVPILYNSDSPVLATVNAASGAGTAGASRGTVTVRAQLLTGQSDQMTLTIVAPPASLGAVSGSGQTGPVNAALPQPVVVIATATDGQPAPGVSVTFAAQNGGSVGSATVVTGANGQASTTWRLGPSAGAQTLTASAAGLSGNPVFTATARVIDPVRLQFAQQPPASTAAGAALTPAITVQAVDATNALTPAFTGMVTIALPAGTPAGVALTGTTSVAAVAGVATFADLKVNVPGSYTLVATSSPLVSATSATFQIVAGSAQRLAFAGYPTAGAASGVAMDPITVQVRDALGNPNTTFVGPVTLTANGPVVAAAENAVGDSAAAASGNADVVLTAPITVNAIAGVATFNNVQLNAAGSYTLTATSTGLTSTTGPAFSVTPGPASALVLVSGGSQSAPGSAALASAVIVKVTDAAGNGIAGRTVTFTPTAGSGTANPVSAVSNAAGFAQTTWTLGAVAGPMTLNIASTGLLPNPLPVGATATSTSGPGPATHLAITTGPSNTVAGAAIAPAIVVTAKDASNGVATGFTGTVTLAIATNPAGGTLSGTASVAAVAGVATFPGLSINKAGTGYTLGASSGALTGAISGAFNITPAAANTIAADSGGGQAGAVANALANAFVVKVTDTFGNPIPSVAIAWAVTAGGGSLGGTTSLTDANGRARTTLTLGGVAGLNTVTATSAVPSGSPVTFNATGGAGAATKLVFLTPPSNVTAGIPISASPVVQAQDALNNPVPSFAGTITMAITTNPGGATLGGTPAEIASSGAATFANLRLNKTGVGYVLTATSGALTPAVSGVFDVTPAPAKTLSIVSGNTQSALVSTALALPLVAKVVDSLGNAVPGTTATWAVATGGGSLTGTVSTADASGQFTTGWTLGAAAGPQSVTLTNAALAGSPLTFTATANSTLANAVWTGANGTAWNDPLNWSPPVVPAATDSVLIQAGGTQPSLTAGATVKHITIAPNATLNLGGFNLVVTGNLDAGTTITGGGSVNLTGSGTVKGKMVTDVYVAGTYSLAGLDSIVGSLYVVTGGALTLAGQTLAVTGDLSVTGVGLINMNTPGDLMYVDGNASFGGAPGTMNSGTLVIRGNFTQTGAANSFAPAATHTTQFFGTTPQSITFADLTGASQFGVLQVVNSGTTTIATDIRAASIDLNVAVGSFAGTGRTAIVRDSVIDPNNRWNVSTVRFTGPNIKLGNALGTATVRFGPGTINLAANASVGGLVIVDSTGTLVLNGKTLAIAGNFSTIASGRVQMTNAADLLDVTGNVSFGGGAQTGLLTAGKIRVAGNFTQLAGTGSGAEFAATAAHITELTGAAAQVINLATPDTLTGACTTSCFGALLANKSSGSVTIGSAAKVMGPLTVNAGFTGFTALGTTGFPRQVIAEGGATLGNVAVHLSRFLVNGAYAPHASVVVDTITYYGAAQTVPAGSHMLARVKGSATLGGNLATTGTLTVDGGSLAFAGFRAVVGGDFATVNAGTITMNAAADSLDVTGNISFAGGPSILTDGAIVARANFAQSAVTNAFAATIGHTTRFISAATQTITFTNPDLVEVPPNANLCTLSCFGDVHVQKTGGRLEFGSGAKALGGFVVGAMTDSLVASGRRLIVNSGFTAPANSRVGLLSSGGPIVTAAGFTADTVIHWGNTHLTVNPLKDLQIWGSDTVTANLETNANVRVFGTGKLVIASGTLGTHANFSTLGGTAQFTQLAGTQLIVDSTIQLAGGLSTPDAGKIQAYGDFIASGATFSATGTHELWFNGPFVGTQTLTFSAPVAGQGIRHLRFDGARTKVISGDVRVVGDLILRNSLGAAVTGPGATVRLGGDLVDSTAFPTDTLGGWRVANTELFGSNSVNAEWMTTNLTISGGTVRFVDNNTPELREGAASTLANVVNPAYAHVNGNVVVTGVSARLDLDDTYLWIYGNFSTQSGGTLQMDHFEARLGVFGNATFAGGSTAGLLTAGELDVLGNFTQGGGAADAFAPSGDHTTWIGQYEGEPDQLRSGAQRNGGIRATQPRRRRTPKPAEVAARAAQAQKVAAARSARDARRAASSARRAAAMAARGVTAPPLVRGSLREVTSGVLTVSNVVSPSTITFANPGFGAGASHFNWFEVTSNLVAGSDIFTEGLSSDGGVIHGTNQKVTANTAYITGVTFDNVRWQLNVSGAMEVVNGVVFSNMSPTVDQFTVQGDGQIDPVDFYDWVFEVTPSSGRYLRAIDTTPTVDTLFVTFVNVSPYGHDGHIQLDGNSLTNWPQVAVATWTNPNESGSWDDETAWDIGIVPDATVDVIIPYSSSSWPTLYGTRAARNLTIETDGESVGYIDLNDNVLQVFGDITVPSGFPFGYAIGCGEGGDGVIEVKSASATIEGRFCGLTIAAGAAAGLADHVIVDRTLTIAGGLTVNGQMLVAEDSLITTGAGTLTMNNDDYDRVWATHVLFGGGPTAGLLTEGTLHVRESFTVTAPGAFAPSGNHETNSDPYDWWTELRAPNALGAANPGSGRLGAIRARATAKATALRAARATAAAAKAAGRVAARNATLASRAAARLKVQTRVAARTGGAAVSQVPAAARTAQNRDVRRVNGGAGYEESYVDVNFADTTGNQFNTLVVDQGGLWYATHVRVARRMTMGYQSTVEGNGHLVIGDSLTGDSYSTMMGRAIEIRGVHADTGYFGPDTTIFAGPADQYIPAIVGSVNNLDYQHVVVKSAARMFSASQAYLVAGALHVTGSGQLRVGDSSDGLAGTDVYITGALTTTGSATLRMNDNDSAYVETSTDSAWFAGGSTAGLLTRGKLYVGGRFRQSGNAQAFAADKPHLTQFGESNTITFANPGFGASHFGDLSVYNDYVVLTTDIFIGGSLIATNASAISTIAGTNQLVTSRGANVAYLYLDNVRWKVTAGDSIGQMTSVQFTNMTPTGTYFTLERHGTGVLPTFDSWTFAPLPTSGKYLELNDLTPGGDVLTLEMTDTSPNAHGGFVTLIGGAVLTGWSSGLATAVASGNWSSAATWGGSVPVTSNIALIPAGITVTLDVPGVSVVGLDIQGSGVLAQGAFDINVNGSIATDTLVGGITCTTGITYQPDLVTGSVRGRFCRYHSGGTITQNGRMTVDSVWHVHDGSFNFAGHRVSTKQAWIGSGGLGGGGGYIIMDNAADSLIVADSMMVGDVSSGALQASQPSAGVIVVNGNFRHIGPDGTANWRPGAGNKTVLAGTAQIVFTDTTSSWLGRVEVTGTRTFNSPVRVEGDLRNAGTITGAAGRIKLGASQTLRGPVGSSLTIRAVELATALADSGTFSPDTVVFFGGSPGNPQVIHDTVGTAGGINLKSVRVTGVVKLAPLSNNANWLLNGKVTVTGSGALLTFGSSGVTTGITIADSLVTANNGAVEMLHATTSVTVNGNARFAGGSTDGLLTAGTLTLAGNLDVQGGSTEAFQPSNSHLTVLTGSGKTVNIALPTSNPFNNLTINSGANILLGTDIRVQGTLTRGAGASTAIINVSGAGQRVITTRGLNITGNPTSIIDVAIVFNDGTANATLDNVTWQGFSTFGGAVLSVTRASGGPYTFNSLNFSAVTGMSGTGRYLVNSGSQAVNILSSNPSPGIAGTHYTNSGSGSINWP